MTDAKPVPEKVLIECRDACATWLARSLGLDAFRNPASAAIGLLLGGGLSPKQATVARVLVWIDRTLPMARLVAEHREGEGLPMFIRPGKDANWYEVETSPPTEEDIQIHREVAALESEFDDALRQIANQWNSLEGVFVRLCAAGMTLEESIARRVQGGRIVGSVQGSGSNPESEEERQAAMRLVQGWRNPYPRWDALTLRYVAVHLELKAFREFAQLRRPFDVEGEFASLTLPRTLDEWRAVRRIFEKALFDAGFNDGEIGEILPDDHPGDVRRRVAARRKRMSIRKTEESKE